MRVHIGPYPHYNSRTKRYKPPVRKISVKIDKWDTWSMDATLAHIILPMLKQLKAAKHSAPLVDSADVPKELRATPAEQRLYDKKGETDAKFFKRWDWVLDEMIWAFSPVNIDWESKFASGKSDLRFQAMDKDGKPLGKPEKLGSKSKQRIKGAVVYKMVHGPKHTYKIDMKARQAHYDRMRRGFRLFGIYYPSRWD